MHRPFQFLKAVTHYWQALVTGGVVIGALGIWQNTGHSVGPWVYWTIAICALLVAAFRGWSEQVTAAEVIKAENSKLREQVQYLKDQPGGPEVWLTFQGKIIGERQLIVKNIAGGTARNVQLEEMSDGQLTAEKSEPIACLTVNECARVNSRVHMSGYGFESHTFNMDNFLSRAKRTIVATVRYEDANGKRFSTSFSITPDTYGLDLNIRQLSRSVLS